MPEILFFPYFGPNRHSDKRVIEFRLDFSRDEAGDALAQVSDIRRLLLDAGLVNEGSVFPAQPLPEDRIGNYSTLLAQTALLLQRKSGHRVDYWSVIPDSVKQRCVALTEHEDSRVGMAAAKLAIEMLIGKLPSFEDAYQQFFRFAQERVLTLETEAIITAARERNIPFLQLEREPLIGYLHTGFRVRPNGLLSLGQGVNRLVLDGTFCVDRAGDYLKALLRNPDQRVAVLKQSGIPVTRHRAAGSEDGKRFYLLAVNGRVTALSAEAGSGRQVVENVHDSIIEQTLAVSEKAGFAPLVVTFQTTDISQPLAQTSGVALDFELGPDLAGLFGPCQDGAGLLARSAGDLLDWLYPGQKNSRIPVITVTGTNGKTTTVRMIRHIFQHKGYQPGLVCTDGIFIGQEQISNIDRSTFMGHAMILTSQKVDAAVLETHHRGIAVHGFAFQHCDVAVCLNVTEEHLAVGEIETIEEMAVIKRALVERGRHAVILFADNEHCLAMLGFVRSDNTCLVSLQSGAQKLRELAGGKAASFCVLETIGEKSWIVLYNRGERLVVMPVSDIPATFNGTAEVNVSNAMHAIAASYFAGIGIESIKAALSIFKADQEYTPGRFNVFDDLPFRIIMDFAHNQDGIQKICEFTDLQTVKGRKLIAFAGLANRSDDNNRKIAQAVAGHFDFYFCKDYEPTTPAKRRLTGPFMQKVLIEEGVPRHATTVTTFGRDVVFRIFDSCRPGDLLLFLAGHIETGKLPGYIREYCARKGMAR